MRERPIPISTGLIPKVLDDTKTQTRRVIKIPTGGRIKPSEHYLDPNNTHEGGVMITYDTSGLAQFRVLPCPYGQVGDRLWVREQHHICCVGMTNHISHRCYYSDGTYKPITAAQALSVQNWASNRPSIHMPHWASRITLEITSLRVERLQEISINDCLAEGVGGGPNLTSKMQFVSLWDSLNAKRGYAWGSNPWVWVIEFRRCDGGT